jgi:hypothetical protein
MQWSPMGSSSLSSFLHSGGAGGSLDGAMPAYVLSNLGANIRRLEQRIEEITQRQARTEAASASTSGVLIEGEEWVRVTFAEKPDRSPRHWSDPAQSRDRQATALER